MARNQRAYSEAWVRMEGILLMIEGEFQKTWSKDFRMGTEGLYEDVTRRPLVFLW